VGETGVWVWNLGEQRERIVKGRRRRRRSKGATTKKEFEMQRVRMVEL